MITINTRLDMRHGAVPEVIHLSQYDSDFTLNFELYASDGSFTMQSGTTAAIRGTKTDGEPFSMDATVSGSTVTVTGTHDQMQQLTAAAGRNIYELTLYKSGKELNTSNFVVLCERAAMDKDTMGGESVIRELVSVIDRTDEIIAAANLADQSCQTVTQLEASAQEASQTATQKASEAAQSASQARTTLNTATATIEQEKASALSQITTLYNQKTNAFNANYESKSDEFDSEYSAQMTAFNRKVSAFNTTYEEAMEAVTRKGEQIVSITTKADKTAAQALTAANNAENHMGYLDNQMKKVQAALNDVSIDPDDLGLEQDPDTYYVYPTYKGVRSENGIPLAGGGGGGGGGGDVISAVLTVENTSGWLSKTIAEGSQCPVSFTWSSIEDEMPTGDGTMRITVNDVVRASMQIAQGNVSVDLAPYLASGTNKVKVRISDSYDQGKTTTFTITSVALSLSSTFDTTQPYTSAFAFPCTPVGSVEKVIHVLVDGTEVATQTTSLSNRQITLNIPAQRHGGHSLTAYFTAEINGEQVRSNTLYYEFVYVEPLNDNVIITSSFNTQEVAQYSSVPIPYTVYDPNSITAEVEIYKNNALVSSQTVDRTEQSYTIKVNEAGTVNIKIQSGSTIKTLSFTVTESEIDVQAETQDLALYLNAVGRSNGEAHPEVWESGNISAQLTGFTWRLDGWQQDSDAITVLRLNDDARVTIPYKLFGQDFKGTGKTIEIEFSTRDVIDYNATILSCLADGIGLKITSQMVEFAGAQTSISTLYKDNEHIRLSIVVEKQSENRLILVYINGIMSRAIQYASGERFSQLTPADITIGSDDCGIDIYCIRVYDNSLNRQQILDNWIADTQVGSEMLERYTHNNVYDAYGAITPANLPSDLPYFIIEGVELPQFKGDKKTVSGSYTNTLFPSKSFTFDGCEIDAQGTSSSVYYVKNLDMKFKNGFVTPNGTISNYALRTGSIPFNRFVLKADVASIEGWNNTGLTMFYNDTCPYKTPEMLENSKVRWGIEGIPIACFFHNTDTGETKFIGKYNFNLPKRAPAPYGYGDDDTLESWEWERNNSANVKFQDNDFASQSWDETKQEYYPTWYDDFEARFPSDTYRDIGQLNTLLAWVKSTWRDEATGNDLANPVTYTLPTNSTVSQYPLDTSYTVTERTVDSSKVYDITFTKDTPAYRLTKFRAEFGQYAEVQSAIFYYLFTEQFLMIDSRAKNMFIGFNGSAV